MVEKLLVRLWDWLSHKLNPETPLTEFERIELLLSRVSVMRRASEPAQSHLFINTSGASVLQDSARLYEINSILETGAILPRYYLNREINPVYVDDWLSPVSYDNIVETMETYYHELNRFFHLYHVNRSENSATYQLHRHTFDALAERFQTNLMELDVICQHLQKHPAG